MSGFRLAVVAPNQFERRYEQILPLDARRVQCDGGADPLVQVCSTQYLGLPWSQSAGVCLRRVVNGVPTSAWGSFGSNYLGGTHRSRLALEQEVSRLCRREAGLAFVSGWAANYGAAEAATRLCDMIISHERNHNSVIHGLRGFRSAVIVRDLTCYSLEGMLRDSKFQRAAVIAPTLEGITGRGVGVSIPPAYRDRVLWISDECHTFGVCGQDGLAYPADTSNECADEPDLRILGLSKAVGAMGAVACGRGDLIHYLAQVASPWMFSTAAPPGMWDITRAFLSIARNMRAERHAIGLLAQRFRSGAVKRGLVVSGSQHISGLHLPADLDVYAFEQKVKLAGFYLKVSSYPTQPRSDPCCRISFTPAHSENDVDALIEVLAGFVGDPET